MRRVSILTAGLAALALAGCQPTGSDQASEKAATADVCQELMHVAEALDHVNDLKPTSTIGEAQTVKKHLDKAIQGLQGAEAELEQARLADFQAKLKTFQKEVAAVSQRQDLTLQQAAADLKSKAAPVLAARQELTATVDCKTPDKH